jgi:8-oxo-dGTP pyrophosphatase MutT (NUDIX family)
MFNYPSDIFDQSAVIPFKKDKKGIKILLIKSRNGKWIIPKGIIEKGFTPHESARKEAIEEAGVDGIVSNFLIGEYKYDKWGGTCNVKVYPMLVKEELLSWEEDFFRIRKWFSIDKAVIKISKPEIADYIKQIPEIFGDQFNGTTRAAQL